MSTTPVVVTKPPTPTIGQDIAAVEKRIGVWLNPTHIVLTVLLILALLGGVYLFESKQVDVAEAKAEAATQLAKAAQDAAATAQVQNAAQQLQNRETQAAMAAANQQLIIANQQLQASNSALVAKLAAQQKQAAALPPSGQAQLWSQLVPGAAVTVTPTGFAIDPIGGLATIQALQEIPVDRARIANFEKEIANDEATIRNDATALNAEKAAHASDNDTNKKTIVAALANNKKIKDDFDVYKKKAHRNYLRFFVAGVIVGLIGGHAAGI